ncbi:hypothetical protein [Trujillonella humicola]|uniref:hypothetical protein n=1 Tax=Trujillonella humicola TaxID=3383699 RepID=UPI00390616B4
MPMTADVSRRRRCATLLAAVGLGVLGTACGGEEPSSAAPASPGTPAGGMPAGSAVPDALPGTPPEVAEALLTTDDLGRGWTDLGALPLDERGLDECPASQVITAGEDPMRRGEAQSLYAQDDRDVPTFGESVSLWQSADVARDRMAEFATLPTDCPPVEREVPDGGTATVRHLAADAPALGDEAVALVHEIRLPEGTIVLRDVVVVRIGDALVLTEGPDVAADDPALGDVRQQFAELTAQAVDKAAQELTP